MIQKIKYLLLLLYLVTISLFAQAQDYHYLRALDGIDKTWHSLELPNEVLLKLNPDYRDLRIYGIKANGDTIEAPYMLRELSSKTTMEEIPFVLLNPSQNKGDYYYTLELEKETAINQIELQFSLQNFDWQLGLEGSNDQKDWFAIGDSYRMLSIKNLHTNFHFTTLNFSNSKYHYYRLRIPSNNNPQLASASIRLQTTVPGKARNYELASVELNEIPEAKQTEWVVELEESAPINFLNMLVYDSFDYYRPLHIEFLSDSFKTEQGWKYHYKTADQVSLNSFDAHAYSFRTIQAKRLKLLIDNQDNQALNLGMIAIKGPIYELIVRFTEEAQYFLAYGNANASAPNYDIVRFSDKIPAIVSPLILGDEELFHTPKTSIQGSPFFENKLWLWMVMLVISALLGWFTLKMMKR